MRDLALMAEGRSRLEWSQTAEVLALIANANRDQKKKPSPFRASEFNPWERADRGRKPRPVKAGIEALKVFVQGKGMES